MLLFYWNNSLSKPRTDIVFYPLLKFSNWREGLEVEKTQKEQNEGEIQLIQQQVLYERPLIIDAVKQSQCFLAPNSDFCPSVSRQKIPWAKIPLSRPRWQFSTQLHCNPFQASASLFNLALYRQPCQQVAWYTGPSAYGRLIKSCLNWPQYL